MHLNPPSFPMFVISMLLIGLAIASSVMPLAYLDGHSAWIMLAGYLVLAMGCLLRGL